MDLRRRKSRSRSASRLSSSVSRSPHKRCVSLSVSRSPHWRSRRSRSPLRRGRSPNYSRRSRTPLRRARSPINTRFPTRRRRSYSRPPRGRSPVGGAHSPRRQRSPQLSRSPRGRSPNVRSPRRRHSPVFVKYSPRRRKSPPRLPSRYRHRSPRYTHSPVRRNISPLVRRRQTVVSTERHPDSSPRRRPRISPPRRGSPSPKVTWSSSPTALSKSPPRRPSSGSLQRNASPSPPHRSMKNSSSGGQNTSFVASLQQSIPASSKGRLSKASISPVQHCKLSTHQKPSSESPSFAKRTVESKSKATDLPLYAANPAALMQHTSVLPSVSPPGQQGSPSLSEVAPMQERCGSKSPLANSRSFVKEIPVRTGQTTQKTFECTASLEKKERSFSRESSLPDEEGEGVRGKKSSVSDANAVVSAAIYGQSASADKAIGFLSKSSSEDQHPSPGEKQRKKDAEIGFNKHVGTASLGMDDRKTARRCRREERRLRKEEKRRKREERHKRKEEKRANKFLSKGITSVTPPPDFDKRMVRSDGFDSSHDEKGEDDDMEIEQIKLENELRRKALDSIRARKVSSS